ncbi:hypothetical protein COLSTE_00077, partial [Collinsella stercoris DSM 13279]
SGERAGGHGFQAATGGALGGGGTMVRHLVEFVVGSGRAGEHSIGLAIGRNPNSRRPRGRRLHAQRRFA